MGDDDVDDFRWFLVLKGFGDFRGQAIKLVSLACVGIKVTRWGMFVSP